MPAEKYCPKGHLCTGGTKRACGSGFYQDEFGKEECKVCPSGFKCTSPIINDATTDGTTAWTTLKSTAILGDGSSTPYATDPAFTSSATYVSKTDFKPQYTAPRSIVDLKYLHTDLNLNQS